VRLPHQGVYETGSNHRQYPPYKIPKGEMIPLTTPSSILLLSQKSREKGKA